MRTVWRLAIGAAALAAGSSGASAFELGYLRVPPGHPVTFYGPLGGQAPRKVPLGTFPPGMIVRVDADTLGDEMVFVDYRDGLSGWVSRDGLDQVHPRELFGGVPRAGVCMGYEPSREISWNGNVALVDVGDRLPRTGHIQRPSLDFAQGKDPGQAIFEVVAEDAQLFVLLDIRELGLSGMRDYEIMAHAEVAIVAGGLIEYYTANCAATDAAFE